jgi:hypothetical protein
VIDLLLLIGEKRISLAVISHDVAAKFLFSPLFVHNKDLISKFTTPCGGARFADVAGDQTDTTP